MNFFQKQVSHLKIFLTGCVGFEWQDFDNGLEEVTVVSRGGFSEKMQTEE